MIMNSLVSIPPLHLSQMLQEMLPDAPSITLLIQELWSLVLEADHNVTGIPLVLLEDYKKEMEKKEKDEQDKKFPSSRNRSFPSFTKRKEERKRTTEEQKRKIPVSSLDEYPLMHKDVNNTHEEDGDGHYDLEGRRSESKFNSYHELDNHNDHKQREREKSPRRVYEYPFPSIHRSSFHASSSNAHHHRGRRDMEESNEYTRSNRRSYRRENEERYSSRSHRRVYDEDDTPISPLSNSRNIAGFSFPSS